MYLLFAGDTYYPNGGWGDFRGLFHSKEEAKEAYEAGVQYGEEYTHHWDWYHIIDAQTFEEIDF